MQLSDETHDYTCSTCRQRGGVCMEALWLSQRVARGLALRATELPADFELTASTRFTGCARECHVALSVSGQRVTVRTGPDGTGAEVTAERRPERGARRVLALGA